MTMAAAQRLRSILSWDRADSRFDGIWRAHPNLVARSRKAFGSMGHGRSGLRWTILKRGFQQVNPDWLPEARKRKYNWDRKSQVLVKKL